MAGNENRPSKDILVTQYERAWQEIKHLDSNYINITLLYIALVGAYIGNVEKIIGFSILISVCITFSSLCVLGIIWRLRKLIDQNFEIISRIEKGTFMFHLWSWENKIVNISWCANYNFDYFGSSLDFE